MKKNTTSRFDRIRWTDDAIAQTYKIIHWQDMLIIGLGDCLKNINRQEYREVKNGLTAIFFIAAAMIKSSDDLMELKKGKSGPKPFWFERGEDTRYFCQQIERARAKIKKEARRGDWGVVSSRLQECLRQCLEIQATILKAMPAEFQPQETYVSQRSVTDWLDFVDTVKMAELTETDEAIRYKKKWR